MTNKHTINHTIPPYYIDGQMISVSPNQSICAMIEFDSFGGYQAAHNFTNNAQFIVRACNSHYDLLEALELAYLCLQDAYTKTGIENDPKFKKMRDAIAKGRF